MLHNSLASSLSLASERDFSASGCLKSALASLKLNLHDERNTHTHTHVYTRVQFVQLPPGCNLALPCCALPIMLHQVRYYTLHVLPAATHNVNVLLPANYTQYCNKKNNNSNNLKQSSKTEGLLLS